jgi:hypothetical protein
MGLYRMNRFLPLFTCLFVGLAATLVSSCASYVIPETVLPAPLMVPPPSAGLAYESGSAAGLHYGPPIGVRYGYYGPPPAYYGPPPEPYYGPPPEPPLGEEQYYGSYGPPPGDDNQYYPPTGPYRAPLYGPPPGAR